MAGLLLLTYFASLSYRHWEKVHLTPTLHPSPQTSLLLNHLPLMQHQDGFEGLADMLFNLQIFILLAAVGMLLLSPTLIGTWTHLLAWWFEIRWPRS